MGGAPSAVVSQTVHSTPCLVLTFFFFKQKTAYEIGLGIPAEPLFRSRWITASSSWKRFCLFIHITIIELNALHTKRQNLFQELDVVIHLLMEAKHWGLRKSRNATSLNRSEERRVGKE